MTQISMTITPILVAELLCNKLAGTPTYWESHAWPLAAGFMTSAVVVWLLGRLLERRPGRLMQDLKTGQRVELRRPHDLFFIPVKYWGVILVVIASVVLATNATPRPPRARAAGSTTHAPSR